MGDPELTPDAPPNARLRLAGHDAGPAWVELLPRTPRTRLVRSALTLLAWWAIAPLVFFIPPHAPWVLGAVGAGLFFAARQWRGDYAVRAFRGACPRCGAELSISPGTLIRLPHPMDCYACHHQPALHAGGA